MPTAKEMARKPREISHLSSSAVMATQPNSANVDRATLWYCREPLSKVLGSRVRKTERAIIQPRKTPMLTSQTPGRTPARMSGGTGMTW